jgi:ATP-binding cassette subfamily F protein 3
MLVSHDRALLRAVCDEFWLVSRGGVAPFDGDLDDYQRYLLDEAKRQREQARAAGAASAASAASAQAAPVSAAPAPSPASAPAKLDKQAQQQQLALLRPLKKELQQIEAEINAQQSEQTQLHEQLAASADPAVLAQAGKRLKAVEQALQELEERWLQLSEQIEQATAA